MSVSYPALFCCIKIIDAESPLVLKLLFSNYALISHNDIYVYAFVYVNRQVKLLNN